MNNHCEFFNIRFLHNWNSKVPAHLSCWIPVSSTGMTSDCARNLFI
ncbi:hypothetical protein wTpre_918 [Wolbachia endosymbiont of Trichogramma pretiosum]|nr:hypothetical protein wTpre_918 [Wolbachia endosymbiont of Trichogramma pretiosum]